MSKYHSDRSRYIFSTDEEEEAHKLGLALGYMLGTGNLYAPPAEFHHFIERLLGKSVWTHEFADEEVYEEARRALEDRLTKWYVLDEEQNQ